MQNQPRPCHPAQTPVPSSTSRTRECALLPFHKHALLSITHLFLLILDLDFNFTPTLQNGRVVFHYGGYGVPPATQDGALWLMASETSATHYSAIAISEIDKILQAPAIYILDCANAGAVLDGV